MVQITAAEVSKLRKITNAGMMDCKRALEEAEGNIETAIEIIRKKGQAVAMKRADRDAAEGVVLAKTCSDSKKGVITVLNCETDFVAKNEGFIKLAEAINEIALNNFPADLDALKKLKFEDTTVGEAVLRQVGIIGEKMELSYYAGIEAAYVVAYIHPGNKLATMAGFNKGGFNAQVGKDVAMQIAAMSPVAIDKENVTKEMIDKEIEIGKEQARNEGKPENMLEKIAQGRLNKFFAESTLLNQEFIKDNKKNVKQYLQEIDKELTVTIFKRYSLNT